MNWKVLCLIASLTLTAGYSEAALSQTQVSPSGAMKKNDTMNHSGSAMKKNDSMNNTSGAMKNNTMNNTSGAMK